MIESLTLLLPEPTPPREGEGWPGMPALQTLLCRGEHGAAAADRWHALCSLFTLPTAEGGELPLGALAALGDRLDSTAGWWLRADPVHLVADRDQLYLSAASSLALTRQESDALVAELNRLYEADGWHFFAPSPQRWYLRLPQPLMMQTTPTAAALGRSMREVLPRGDDAMSWQRTMTEIQMLLHGSSVNLQRQAEGALAVNGVWFWGGGMLPAAIGKVSWDRVLSDAPLTRGLALRYGLPLSEASGHSVDALARLGGRVLWDGGNLPFTPDTAARLEQQLFSPLLELLRQGELSRLALVIPGTGRWEVSRGMLRRWWRRRKPLASLLRGMT